MSANVTDTRAVQAAALNVAAKLAEISDGLTACVQQDSDGEDMLEALELTGEDLADLSAKCYMQAQEIRFSGGLNEKTDSMKFIEATKLLFRSPAFDRLIHAARVFKNANASNILEALCELGNSSVVVAYACNQALERAKKTAVDSGMELKCIRDIER